MKLESVGWGNTCSFPVADGTTAGGMTSQYAAQSILSAVELRKQEVILSSFAHKFAIWFRNILPNVFFSMMKSRAKKQANEYMK